MKYLQITFQITPDSEIARDILTSLASEAGCESFTEEGGSWVGYAQEKLFQDEMLKAYCENFPIPDTKIAYTIKEAENRNWNEEWEQNGFSPIIIDDRCIICSSKEENPFELLTENTIKEPLVVRIDPRQAFGSGTHETTQMIVSQLFDEDLRAKSVLDCGCGTGILGIVAAKLGAATVCAYDIDEWSVRNTEDNAKLNGVEIQVLEGDKHITSNFDGQFDLVIANINRNILLNDIETFRVKLKQDGKLILSGFYTEDAAILEQKASTLGLHLCQQRENHNWCCLIFRLS
ncbi:50S ribosomal protein L11 methyltransferase [Prevotella sp. HUN102]|uniref:50S ribosomal protein L11 methyltransferase n=1 Tax=Prevotella sp. HUN102 TaxID=1392486 RepID=UPI00048A93C8|nr:50S ribosomal protein L11 methyltransferase [Prevotella sp. HUN102]